MQPELEFIKGRINEIRSALFYNDGNPFTRFPTCIIRCLDVDEQGYVWFFINDDGFSYPEEPRKFPASLSFYRKGKSFFIRVQGLAEVVNNEIVIENFIGHPAHYELVLEKMKLVKVKIEEADYHEWSQKSSLPWWQRVYQHLQQLIFRPTSVKQPHYSFS